MTKNKQTEEQSKINSMCLNCGKFGGECKGTTEQVWTGCIYKTEKFEVFYGCLGSITMVCNKAVMENGDYKRIAYISEGGNIRLCVAESYIPADAMKNIKAMAKRDAAKFQKRFENLSLIEQYGKIIDRVPHEKFMEYVGDKRPLEKKLPAMREYYYTIM